MHSLRFRLTLIFVGLAVGPLVFVGLITERQSYTNLQQQSLALQREIVAGVSGEIRAFVEQRENELALLDSVNRLGTLELEEQREILNTMLLLHRVYQEITLLDTQGQEQIRLSRSKVFLDEDLKSRRGDAAFQVPMTSGDIYFGSVHFDQAIREPLVTIACPLYDQYSGEIVSVVVATLRFKPIWDLLTEIEALPEGDVFVVDQTGQVIAHRNPAVVLSGTTITLPDQDGPAKGLDGQDVISVKDSLRFGNQELVVIAEESVSNAFRLAADSRQVTLMVITYALATAIVLVILTTRRIVSPIEVLAAAAQTISKGDFSQHVLVPVQSKEEYTGRLALKVLKPLFVVIHRLTKSDWKLENHLNAHDEIGELALTFNNMVHDLQVRDESLQTQRKELRESEEKFRGLAEQSPNMIFINQRGKVVYANERCEEVMGYKKEVFLTPGFDFFELIAPESRHLITEKLKRRARGEEIPPYECSLMTKEGKEIVGIISTKLITYEGSDAILGIITDITSRIQAEEALRESEERYALAARGANDGLWDWHLIKSEIYFSRRWKDMVGYEEDEIGSTPNGWFNLVHPDDLESVMADIAAHINGTTPHFENEHRMRHKNGTYRWMLTRGQAINDEDGSAYRMAGSQTDITVRKQVEEQLLYDAFHDVLTGLANRALFMERLGASIGRAKRRQDFGFAVLFLDVDRFKIINDSLGHPIGDDLLIEIARRLALCLRPADIAARIGGDEFVILLEDVSDAGGAMSIADWIQESLGLPFTLDGHDIITTASIGIVLSGMGHKRAEDILRDADIAMYRAKGLGGAGNQFFDSALHAGALERLKLESDLWMALERQEFQLHYQPIVVLETGKLMGFEALVRWVHPERGLVSPGDFIPLAEEIGLIVPIGRWVLNEACRQVNAWQTQFPLEPSLSISVNLSSKQLDQPDIIDQIEETLQNTRLDAQSLNLEITESVAMSHRESTIRFLSKMKELGVQVHMDDFGTGYSSLSALNQFRFDTIKIDRSFISELGHESSRAGIVKTIVELAHELNMSVIAEGVEVESQLAQLNAFKCEYAQGYLISKPLDSETAGTLISQSYRNQKVPYLSQNGGENYAILAEEEHLVGNNIMSYLNWQSNGATLISPKEAVQ